MPINDDVSTKEITEHQMRHGTTFMSVRLGKTT